MMEKSLLNKLPFLGRLPLYEKVVLQYKRRGREELANAICTLADYCECTVEAHRKREIE